MSSIADIMLPVITTKFVPLATSIRNFPLNPAINSPWFYHSQDAQFQKNSRWRLLHAC
eukprot:m.168608 g.168608  ORF g.168608 m.168608 type:complete len:58 (+) comp14480_c0_seq2:260-433(+)